MWVTNIFKSAFNRRRKFTTSKRFWIDRYKNDGNSGAGSYNLLAEFKAKVVNNFIKDNEIDSVIEFGCGDGNQLRYFDIGSYLGFDVSPHAIDLCKSIFDGDDSKEFRLLSAYAKEMADLTMSLDVIYHLVENEVYNDHMHVLFGATRKYVVIYSSNADEHENNDVVDHVKHRKFTNWIENHAKEFGLKQHFKNIYPYNGDGEGTSYASFYIYERKHPLY